jgi:hypothetical protein
LRLYSDIISLTRNGRGLYCIDTTMGCKSGMDANDKGCYNDCYAARLAKRYGHDFHTTVLRFFKSERHKREILSEIRRINMPFIRIGVSGDPSENWQHTLNILRTLSKANIEIVIITRHWTLLTDEQLLCLSKMNICINTSASALDNEEMRATALEQFKRIKPYCKSILRIISCDFNVNNETGKRLSDIQHSLFKNYPTLDTVFRPSKKNKFITDGIINVKAQVFNGKKQLASKFNKKTYMGKCSACKEMCGVNISDNQKHSNKRGIVIQLSLYEKYYTPSEEEKQTWTG